MIDAKKVWQQVGDKLCSINAVCLYRSDTGIELVGPSTTRAMHCEDKGMTLCGLYTIAPSLDQIEMDLTA